MMDNNDIDFFDSLNILSERKYLIIIILSIFLLVSLLYGYIFILRVPPNYSIKTVIHFPNEDHLNQKIFNKFNGWFESGAYKTALMEKYPLLTPPKIDTHIHQRAFAEIGMNYPDIEKGKRLLIDVLEILKASNLMKRYLNKTKETLNRSLQSLTHQMNDLTNQIEKSRAKISDYMKDIRYTLQIISKLQMDLDKLKNQKESEKKENENSSSRLFNQYKETVMSFITHLQRNNEKTKYEIFLEKDRLDALINKVNGKQREISHARERINKIGAYYSIEAPPYATQLPSEKTFHMARIVIIAGIIGLAFGCFISLILGVRERRENSV